MSQQPFDQRPTNTVPARRWIVRAVALFLVGAIGSAVFPNLVLHLTGTWSEVSPGVAWTVEVLVSLIQWGCFATGGALIAAALVIQRLPPTTDDLQVPDSWADGESGA